MTIRVLLATQNLQFRFSGKMARLLGRESVSSDVAALFELVKNAYDADATEASVRFVNVKSETEAEQTIIVEDNGHGMTADDIKNRWMVIGTDDKERNETTRKGRRMTGNKGVGRFSTEKLAHKATLVSQPIGRQEQSTLSVDWDKYEGENITFGDVDNEFETIATGSNSKDHGTKLILAELRTQWSKEKIAQLQKAISALVLPKRIQEMRGDPFNVEIQAEEFGDFGKMHIGSSLFDAAPYKVVATIMDGMTDCIPRIYKKGKIVRQDPVEMSDAELEDGEKWVNFGRCKITLYFYPERNRYEGWDKHYKGILNVYKISSLIKDFNGVKIYRDNFWVRPYGEEGNDWLDLEAERVQSFLRIGNSRLIGFVEITKEGNKGIIDTTTRERLDENIYFKSMKLFVKRVINELYYYRDKEFKQLREERKKQEHKNIVDSELSHIKALLEKQPIPVPTKKEIGKSISEIRRTLKNFEEDTSEEYKMLEKAERAYRNLASLGISTASVSHEIFNLINNFDEIPNSIKNVMDENTWSDSRIEEDLNGARTFIQLVKHYAGFNRTFVKNIAKDAEGKESEKLEVKDELDKVKETFTKILADEYDIECRIDPPSLSIYMNQADFMSILLNLLANSLSAFAERDDPGKKRIRITFYRDVRHLEIRFSDNGSGVSDSDKTQIFDLFFTTKAKGTGLGLAIVKEIVELYDGTVHLHASSELGHGATFIIRMPWEKIGR